MPDWKKQIKLSIRLRVGIRNYFIKEIYNPLQIIRRRNGLADKDLFKHVLVQTNYKCTRKCYFCHYGLENAPENIDMKEDLFYDIIVQLKDIKYRGRVGLFEMNEPLTEKRLNKFVIFTRKMLPHAWVFISSNGDLLNVKKAEQLFENGLNYIHLSSYDETALKKNKKTIQQIQPKYKKRINHINRTYQTEWSSRGGHVKQFKKNVVYAPCDLVQTVFYIKPTGKVYSCYNDFENVNDMGDLNHSRVLEIWFGARFRQLRKDLIVGNRNCSKLCNQCDYVGYTNLPKVPFNWKLRNLLKRHRNL